MGVIWQAHYRDAVYVKGRIYGCNCYERSMTVTGLVMIVTVIGGYMTVTVMGDL